MTFYDWAGWLWSQGYNVIPGTRGSKSAARPWKEYQTSRVPKSKIKEWFLFRDYMPLVVTGQVSSVVVIDTDTPEAAIWVVCNLPDTRRVITPRGMHHYFAFHPQGITRNCAHFKVDGDIFIDIRANGGYVLGPGAVNSKVYEPLDWELPMATIPQDWIEKSGIKAREALKKSRSRLISGLDRPDAPWLQAQSRHFDIKKRLTSGEYFMMLQPPAIEGQAGNNLTFRCVCHLMHYLGLGHYEILLATKKWNENCEPPWSMEELEIIIHNAALYGNGG